METIEKALRNERCKLEKQVEAAKRRLKTAPDGFLRINKKRDGVEYYLKTAEEKGLNGRYLKKNERNLAERIAQRDYDMKFVKIAEQRIKDITGFLKKYDETGLERLYDETNPYRRELLREAVLSDEEYIKRWLAVEYEGKPHTADSPEILTERGERVRSKSEKIIADKLNVLGIPYRYECPLKLVGNLTIYPDFTILKMPTREEVYLEHLGMLDDDNYMDTVIYKLNTYEKNGIYFGVNLFITHETKKIPLNTRALDRLLKELFVWNEK